MRERRSPKIRKKIRTIKEKTGRKVEIGRKTEMGERSLLQYIEIMTASFYIAKTLELPGLYPLYIRQRFYPCITPGTPMRGGGPQDADAKTIICSLKLSNGESVCERQD